MKQQNYLFIGGSREGVGTVRPAQRALTFVDGLLAGPGEPGDRPLNATIEHYVREPIGGSGGGEGSFAYFLEGLEQAECDSRLTALLKKFTPDGEPLRPA